LKELNIGMNFGNGKKKKEKKVFLKSGLKRR
jgi:hypothetical protein